MQAICLPESLIKKITDVHITTYVTYTTGSCVREANFLQKYTLQTHGWKSHTLIRSFSSLLGIT